VQLALDLGGEVVSADSMQIYKYMDIGTAKPEKDEMCGVVHHMLDVVEPDRDYSVSLYAQAAIACIEDIHSRGKVPIVVGGTGLYYDAILKTDGYAPGPDEKLRQELEEFAQTNGDEALFERLKREFDRLVRENKLKYQIVPYFISSHPGCTLKDMELLSKNKSLKGVYMDQVQDFTPTPMTKSSVSYYSEMDPKTFEPLFVEKNITKKREQKSYLLMK
jgi:tRNA dimethylallyltransferase